MADNINPEGIKNMLNNDWADMSLKDLKDMQSMVQQSKNLKRKNNLRHDIKELSKQAEETLDTMDSVLSAAIAERTRELAQQNKGFKGLFKRLGKGSKGGSTSGGSTKGNSKSGGGIKGGLKSIGSSLLKKLPFAALGAATSLFAATLKNATLVVQKFSRAMSSAASLGKNIKNLDILMGGTAKELTEASAGKGMLSTLLGGVGNQIKNFFGKLANTIISDDVKNALAKTIREGFILANQSTLIGQGHRSDQANALARLATDAAETYLRQTTGASLEDISNADNYKEIVNEMLKLIISDGQYEIFSTSGWKGWAFEQGYLVPGMNYTQQQENIMRAEYLGELLNMYRDNGADALAAMQNYYQKVDKRLSLMGQSLYSFDEVEQVAAYTEADTLNELRNFSEGTQDQLGDVESDVKQLGFEYNLTRGQVKNITDFMKATGLSVDDIKYLLENGITFEDPQAVAYLAELVNNGLTTKGIVQLQGLDDIDLNIPETTKEILDKFIDALNKLGINGNTGGGNTGGGDTGGGDTGGGDTGGTGGGITKTEIELPVYEPITKQFMLRKDAEEIRRMTESNTRLDNTYEETNEDDLIKAANKYIKDIVDKGMAVNDIEAYIEGIKNVFEGFGFDFSRVDLSSFEEYKDRSTLGTEFTTTFKTQSMNPAFGLMRANGGIGTQRVDGLTLFENGPEAIIPLTSNLGVDYMARVMEQVNASNGSSDSLTVNFNGPVFTEDQRQLHYWAEKLGETYDTIKKRRGVV